MHLYLFQAKTQKTVHSSWASAKNKNVVKGTGFVITLNCSDKQVCSQFCHTATDKELTFSCLCTTSHRARRLRKFSGPGNRSLM